MILNLIPFIIICSIYLLIIISLIVLLLCGVKEVILIIGSCSILLIIGIAFELLPRIIELINNLRISNDNKKITSEGKIIKISIIKSMLYSSRFSQSAKVYYIKFDLILDGNINTYIYPLVNNNVYCNDLEINKILKSINEDFKEKTYKFTILGSVIEQVKPNIIRQIINKIAK